VVGEACEMTCEKRGMGGEMLNTAMAEHGCAVVEQKGKKRWSQ
jgi:hypothetical protein